MNTVTNTVYTPIAAMRGDCAYTKPLSSIIKTQCHITSSGQLSKGTLILFWQNMKVSEVI